MHSAERQEGVVTRMTALPKPQPTGMEIVLIVLSKLLQATTCYVEQLQFHFSRGHTVFLSLDTVLFSRACRLNHLVNSAVAIGWQEAFAKDEGHLVERIGFLIEAQRLPVCAATQHLRFVILHRHPISLISLALVLNA